MASVAAERRKRRVRFAGIASTGIAAAIATLLTLTYEPDMEDVLKRHYTRLAEKELDIISLTEENHPHEMEEVINSIHSITFEAIPLEDQLPEELPVKERIRILNEYYNQKYEALESLMAQL
jgi:uncharacterized membrane protein YhiD involved in acid resistance